MFRYRYRRRRRRHRVASSGRRVAPPWPRRMACLSPEVGRNRSSVVAELVCPARARTTSIPKHRDIVSVVTEAEENGTDKGKGRLRKD